MKTIRLSENRGHMKTDWLDTKHSFSFGEYYDPNNMGWGALRVINDDKIAASTGFPTHPHRDMEIFSYVTQGALAHKDSMGNEEQVGPGRIQLMSAGSGVHHSEFNPSNIEEARLLQIWIQPHTTNLLPNYQDLTIEEESILNKWKLLMSPEGGMGGLKIMQDAKVFCAKLDSNQSLLVPSSKDRKGYLHVIDGQVLENKTPLNGGDALALEDEVSFPITARASSELLYFDLPK